MKKIVALSIVSLFLSASTDLMAAKKKRSKKKYRTSTSKTLKQKKRKKKITQKLKKKQAAVTEAALSSSKDKSKFALTYLADISTSRNGSTGADAYDVNGYSLTQQMTGKYSVSKNDILSLTARVDTSKSRNDITDPEVEQNKTEDNTFNRVYARYMRTGILTEKAHGIGLTAFGDLRYYSDAASRGRGDGIVRPAVSFTKTFGRVSTNVTLFRAQYWNVDSNKLADGTANDFYNYITFGPSIEVTDKLSFALLGEYIKVYRRNGDVGTETTDFAVSATYAFTPAVSGDFYVDSDGTMVPGDGGALFSDDWSDRVNYGVSFTFKVL